MQFAMNFLHLLREGKTHSEENEAISLLGVVFIGKKNQHPYLNYNKG